MKLTYSNGFHAREVMGVRVCQRGNGWNNKMF